MYVNTDVSFINCYRVSKTCLKRNKKVKQNK